jgi:hypothetical protein
MNLTANAHQPTVRQLLLSETMSEAQVLYGEELLDRHVTQVVSSFNSMPRAGSVLVLRMEHAPIRDAAAIKDIAALVIIRSLSADATPSLPSVPLSAPLSAPAVGTGAEALAPQHQTANLLQYDIVLKGLSKVCEEASVPLIVVPTFGDPSPIADEIRIAFLKELKLLSARLHAHLMTVLLDEGLEGLVEEVSRVQAPRFQKYGRHACRSAPRRRRLLLRLPQTNAEGQSQRR